MARRSTALILALLAACGGERAESLFERALAALRDGDLRAAESLARGAAELGGARFVAPHAFLSGNIAFARCEMAERQAATLAAEPFAWDVAINYGRKARDLWQRAAMSRDDWPAARRNVERALLKLEELKRKKESADPRRRKEADGKPPPPPLPPPPGPEKRTEEEAAVDPQLEKLTPAQVVRLIEKLAEKEREKLALRRADREARTKKVERDW